jgi:Zn-dependent protease
MGRVAGISISVHVTFFILVVLFAVAEAQPGGLGVFGGLLWLVLIFACVLAHELAHSLVARSKGCVVRAIVLLPIGGVSQIERMPEEWSDELAIAAAGPLASLALAVLAGLGAAATGARLWPINLYGGPLLARLAWLNVLLGMFNLLPAFPMDGGRVLRAALERRHSVEVATRLAARVGRMLGVAMAVVGLFWDFWLIIIGAFVFIAATQEERVTTFHQWLRGVRVCDLMRSGVTTIEADQPAGQAAGWWSGPQVVTLDGRYYGLADGAALRAAGPGRRVGEFVDREAPTLSPSEDLGRSGLDELVSSGYRALAVVDGTTVVGVLMVDDIETWLRRRTPARQ